MPSWLDLILSRLISHCFLVLFLVFQYISVSLLYIKCLSPFNLFRTGSAASLCPSKDSHCNFLPHNSSWSGMTYLCDSIMPVSSTRLYFPWDQRFPPWSHLLSNLHAFGSQVYIFLPGLYPKLLACIPALDSIPSWGWQIDIANIRSKSQLLLPVVFPSFCSLPISVLTLTPFFRLHKGKELVVVSLIFLFLSYPIPGLSAKPLSITFKIYPEFDYFSTPHCHQPQPSQHHFSPGFLQ